VRRAVAGAPCHKESVLLPGVRDRIAQLGRGLGWHGALSADVIADARGRHVVIDVNPRLVEPVNAWRSGTDLVGALVDAARGRPPADRPSGRGGVRTHQLLLSILGVAERTGSRRAVWRLPRAVAVSLLSSVDATLDVFDSGATSPAMRRSRKASRGSQLFELMLPRCTDFGPRRHRAWGPDAEPFGGSRCLSHSSCWTTSKPRTSTFMPRRLSSSCPPAGRAALQRS